MNHPFNLALTELQMLDLEFEQSVTPEEADQVNGSWRCVTFPNSEAGNDFNPKPRPIPKPFPRPLPKPIDPPIYTTLALGEEGGDWNPPEVTTMALGEEGGSLNPLL